MHASSSSPYTENSKTQPQRPTSSNISKIPRIPSSPKQMYIIARIRYLNRHRKYLYIFFKTNYFYNQLNAFLFRTSPLPNENRNGGISEKANRNTITSTNSKTNDLSNQPAIRQSLGPNTATIYSKPSSIHKTNKPNQENSRRVKITT